MSLRKKHRFLAVAAAAALVLGAGAAAAADDPNESETPETPPAATALTEAEISGVLVTVNNGEVALARLALMRSASPAVRIYAQRMLLDHSRANQLVFATAASLGMTPVASEVTRNMQEQGTLQVATLAQLFGPAFDLAYIDQQIKAHTQALELLERRLVPTAEMPALRNLLTSTHDMVVKHLDLANVVRATLL
ncbi:MAG: DUF4142 domain-containing protein [Minicystis sp.]